MNTRTMKPQNPTNTPRSGKVLFKKNQNLMIFIVIILGVDVPKVIKL